MQSKEQNVISWFLLNELRQKAEKVILRYFLDARKNITILTEIQRFFFLLLKLGFDVKEYEGPLAKF